MNEKYKRWAMNFHGDYINLNLFHDFFKASDKYMERYIHYLQDKRQGLRPYDPKYPYIKNALRNAAITDSFKELRSTFEANLKATSDKYESGINFSGEEL